jgi:acylphosphatase
VGTGTDLNAANTIQARFHQLAAQNFRRVQRKAMGKTTAKIAKKFSIAGRVQGVGFRYFAEHWASQLGICGYVKNLWDGSVEVYAIGDPVALEELKRQLAEGPRSAHVANIMESDEPVDERYNYFVIEGGW